MEGYGIGIGAPPSAMCYGGAGGVAGGSPLLQPAPLPQDGFGMAPAPPPPPPQQPGGMLVPSFYGVAEEAPPLGGGQPVMQDGFSPSPPGGTMTASFYGRGSPADASPHGLEPGMSSAEVQAAADAVRWCLDHPEETQVAVETYFHEYAGKRGLSFERATEMMPQLLTGLGLPQSVFVHLDAMLHRFDFDGNNMLDENEVQKMFTIGLKHKWRELTGEPFEDVRVREVDSVEEAGYVVEKELGRGGQGVMYLAKKPLSTVPYCIKFYSKIDANAGGLEELKEEFAIMHMLHHDNIAKTFEVFQDHSYYYLVNQPYFGGDLTEIGSRAGSKVDMAEQWWRQIFAQCLDGLCFLHSNAIMHCDLKEPNVMVAYNDSFKEPHVVLIDFGLASSFSTDGVGVQGTPGYIPPETWRDGIWYPRGDIFSLGVMFFQLLTGHVPTGNNRVPGLFTEDARSVEDVIRHTQQREPDWRRFPDWPAARDLVASMLHKVKAERPVALQANEHPWFSATSNAELPREIAFQLIGRATEAISRRRILEQLEEKNNLRKLRRLEHKLAGVADSVGRVPTAGFIKLMVHAGVDDAELREYASITQDQNGRVPYRDLLQDAVFAKEKYSEKEVLDMFVLADIHRRGYLQKEEVQTFFESDRFEISHEVVEELVSRMDMDDNGNIDFQEFRRVVMEDGQISRRSEVTARARVRDMCKGGCEPVQCSIS